MKNAAIAIFTLCSVAACSMQDTKPPAAAASKSSQATTGNESQFAHKLDTILAGDWRSATNKARDQYRHPKQTLEFFGLKSAATLIEISPGGGWYTEILAPLLKGDGTYIAANAKPRKPDGEAAQDKSTLQKKFDGDAVRYGEARLVEYDSKAPVLGAPASADMIVTFRNVHNWVQADTAPVMFKAFFDVLKPGGVLGVVDHRAAPGADLKKIIDTGYLPEDYVIKLATDAGFKLAAKSEINANPKDTKDYPKGVWTLPPSLELGEQDKAKYLAIGESDRMTLKFVKPGTDRIFSAPDGKH